MSGVLSVLFIDDCSANRGVSKKTIVEILGFLPCIAKEKANKVMSDRNDFLRIRSLAPGRSIISGLPGSLHSE